MGFCRFALKDILVYAVMGAAPLFWYAVDVIELQCPWVVIAAPLALSTESEHSAQATPDVGPAPNSACIQNQPIAYCVEGIW